MEVDQDPLQQQQQAGAAGSSELMALSDCVYATITWQDYARISGGLLKLTLAALQKMPSERTDSETRVLVTCFKEIDIVEDLSFKTLKEQLCDLHQN